MLWYLNYRSKDYCIYDNNADIFALECFISEPQHYFSFKEQTPTGKKT